MRPVLALLLLVVAAVGAPAPHPAAAAPTEQDPFFGYAPPPPLPSVARRASGQQLDVRLREVFAGDAALSPTPAPAAAAAAVPQPPALLEVHYVNQPSPPPMPELPAAPREDPLQLAARDE
jgi:hypothetical protein